MPAEGATNRCVTPFLVTLVAVLMGFTTGVCAQAAAWDFALPSLSGPTVRLADLAGQPAILLFGNTHCPHCQDAVGLLAELHEQYADRLAVVFIAVRQPLNDVLDHYFGQHMTYEVLVDVDGLVASRYGVHAVPTCIGIDAEGEIVYRGRLSEALAVALIEDDARTLSDLSARPPDRGPRAADRLQRRAGTWQVPQRFIVELDEPPHAVRKAAPAVREGRRRELDRAARRIGARIIHNYGRWKNRIVLEIPPDRLDRLASLPGFKNAKPDPVVRALIADTAGQIRADYAWDNAVTGQGVKVCVVDTGVDWSHPMLRNKVVAQYDFFEGDDDAMDDNGHGTHVAGIIASQGLTYRGISYDADILAAKVLGANGDGYASDVALGIEWCVEQGARVINLSLGEGLYADTCDGTEMAQAVNAAVDAGAVVVCASGNDGNPHEIVSPACASKAIAVGAVDKLDGIASYSDGGKELDLVAPGGDQLGGEHYPEIVSAYSTLVAQNPDLCMYNLAEMCYDNWFLVEGDLYIRAVGTSMAAPHVTAAAALLLEANPQLTATQVKELLQSTALDLGAPGWDNIYGWGRIDLEKALDSLPAAAGELAVEITDPNDPSSVLQNQVFDLAAAVTCLGGDGCGEVNVLAEWAEANDPNGMFFPLGLESPLATENPNPVAIGALSGVTLETEAPARFDVETVHDLTDQTFAKIPSPETAVIGSDLALSYTSGDLEPEDGLGAIGEDAQKIYEFTIPAGDPSRLLVQMEHFFVFQWDDPPAGWRVELCMADGTPLGLVGECIPPSGGGGEPPSPDCWFVTSDPAVLAALNPGGVNHLRLSSFGVDADDHLAFNNIYVHVEYEIDPAFDDVHRYIVQFDLAGIDPNYEVTAARLSLTIPAGAETAVGEIHLVDPALEPDDDAESLYNAGAPAYSTLVNPLKTFGAEQIATLTINLRAAVAEALDAGMDRLTLSIREQGNDRKFLLGGLTSETPPRLVVSQRVPLDMAAPDGGEPGPAPGPLAVSYDTHVRRDISEETYTRNDAPAIAPVGSTMVTEYSTGDLEPEDGVGAVSEDAQKVYAFELPPGQPEEIRIRMEHYVVLQFDDPPSRWQIYTCDPNGNEWHLIDECTPISGGGGEPPPPDCWFVSSDPAVLADLRPGQTNYIKLRSIDVGEFDMLSFNTLELIARYPLDPDNDWVHRYYMQFDLSALPTDAAIDAAVLNLNIVDSAEDAVGQVRLVDNTYGPGTGAYTIYHAPDAPYSNLANPVKTFGAEQPGPRRIQLRPAVEDALNSPARRLGLLIIEQDENALFTLAGAASTTPPTLEVHLRSGATSGSAAWAVQALSPGRYRVRVSAVGSLGPAANDEVLVTVDDPNRPVVEEIQCLIDAQWGDCHKATYGRRIDAIRVAARDPQQVPHVRIIARNLPDDRTWIDADAAWDGEHFIVPDVNLLIEDSGQWVVRAVARDDDDNTAEMSVTWDVPWGRILARHVAPAGPVDAPKGTTFTVTSEVECIEAECSDVRVWLGVNEPVEIRYDDGSAEDYGEIGASDAYVAARITPASYPATLQKARFFIYDKTAYPFELHIWAANGPTDPDNPSVRMPGTELIPPFVVYPVVTGPHDVQWFDVDVSDRNITLNAGDLYIGWRQLEDTRNNQVGFDTNSTRQKRTWAYLDLLGGWFNLDGFCDWDPQFCGNIMIGAVFGEPAYYQGQVPTEPAIAPVYVSGSHPRSLGDLKAGQTQQTTFTLAATGPVGDRARIRAAAASRSSLARTATLDVTLTTPRNVFEAANLDAFGPVDLSDLALLAAGWLDDQPPLFADANADGRVDLSDLALLAQSWLKTTPD
ncbi:MAG TPA: redoxin domain-containing protein [Phycisphaerales bacterium]|nr:redoxin domain-containing protein [Phycisphaerales bacterium]